MTGISKKYGAISQRITALACLESSWKCSEESYSNGEPNESGHTTVWYGGGKEHCHCALRVIHFNVTQLYHVQLFQCQRVLRIINVPYEV